ncbi:glycosyltransferase family 2 protein [Gymnodinialimonas sp. 57CJ19]|uniref:glycosyltransferase family 2 protein n=1 Tax=Gymnodinialimonas sp. 57CJ19 TaxID=3138498 RepID=UPI00313432EF
MALETEHLQLVGADKTDRGAYVCLLLVHNEGNLIEPFLEHYRSFGNITFIVIDDRSTDGSTEFLLAQPNVTVLAPKEGSTYAKHKREWRGQVLDEVADGRWILAPDADEHLFWHGAPERSFDDLIRVLDAEGAGALYAIMIDMYADRPLDEHVYTGGSLSQSFPLFDDPRIDPAGTWMERGASRFLKNWPTPAVSVLGGMRQRLVDSQSSQLIPLRRFNRRLLGRLRDHQGMGSNFGRALTKHPKTMPANLLTKLPLVKWKRGFRFYGGAHSLNAETAISSERAVLLHFPVTRGRDGLDSIVSRGQHSANSGHYRALLGVAEINPTYYGTRELTSLKDMDGITLPPRRPT